MSTLLVRNSILVLVLASFSAIKAGTPKMKNQCTKITSLKSESNPPLEQATASTSPKIKGKKVLEDAWSCVSCPWIAKKFGEILNDNNKTADEKIAEMNELYRALKGPARYAKRQLEMNPNEINPVLRVWIDILVSEEVAYQTSRAVLLNYYLTDHTSVSISSEIDECCHFQIRRRLWQHQDLVEDQFRDQLGDDALDNLCDDNRNKIKAHLSLHKVLDQAQNQLNDQASVFFQKLDLQNAECLDSELPVIIHYAFLVFQLTAHFRLEYSSLNNLDIPSDFEDDFIPTLKELIKTQLSLLGNDGTDFPIRNELQRMLDHFPDETEE